jgi:hypothetical protein
MQQLDIELKFFGSIITNNNNNNNILIASDGMYNQLLVFDVTKSSRRPSMANQPTNQPVGHGLHISREYFSLILIHSFD